MSNNEAYRNMPLPDSVNGERIKKRRLSTKELRAKDILRYLYPKYLKLRYQILE